MKLKIIDYPYFNEGLGQMHCLSFEPLVSGFLINYFGLPRLTYYIIPKSIFFGISYYYYNQEDNTIATIYLSLSLIVIWVVLYYFTKLILNLPKLITGYLQVPKKINI